MANRISTENGQEETKKLITWQQCKVCGTNYPTSQTVCYTCWRKAEADDTEKTGNLLESRFSKKGKPSISFFSSCFSCSKKSKSRKY